MTISGTSTQPFVAAVLCILGLLYSALCYSANALKVNKHIKEIISFFLTVIGALLYFAALFLINSGEMRLYTLLSYLLGLISGFRLFSIIRFRKTVK